MTASLGKNSGTCIAQSRGTFSGHEPGSLPRKNTKNTSGKIGRHDLIREVQAILLQFPIKEAAELQDTTTRAVESQRNGDSAISLLAAANMCRSNPRARAMFGKLFGFSGAHTDPDFMEGMEKLAQGYLRQQAAMFGIALPECSADEAQTVGDSSLTGAGEDKDVLTGDLFEAMGNA